MTAARKIHVVATSQGRGHPCGQSRHMTVPIPCRYIIVCYILPLEVVDRSCSLSMLLLLCLHGVTPVGEDILAGDSACLLAADNQQWRWHGGSGLHTALDFKFCGFHMRLFFSYYWASYSTFFCNLVYF